jgi:hypothetical protein
MPRAFCIHVEDNVATLLDDAPQPGVARILGTARVNEVASLEPIMLGHKIAICDMPAGQPVVKFGVTIGRASRDIRAGQWVHLHNCESTFDQRSQTLDLHTGAATDTKYE